MKTCVSIADCVLSVVPLPHGTCRNPRSKSLTRATRRFHAPASRLAKPHKRFRHQAREREWHWLGQRQYTADEVHLPDGRASVGKELFPFQHPRPAHLV